MPLNTDHFLIANPEDTGGFLKEVPSGTAVDNVFTFSSGGKVWRRIVDQGAYRAKWVVNGTGDQTSRLQAVFNHDDVKEVIIDNGDVTVNGVLNCGGKKITFTNNGKIIGTGTLNNAVIVAEARQHIFATTFNMTNCNVVDGEFSAMWYGAVGDDFTDNSVMLQKAADACVYNYIPRLYIPEGTYRISKGILFCRLVNGNPTFFSLEISGSCKAYIGGANETTIKVTNKTNFGIGVQRAKGVKIKNLHVLGQNPLWGVTEGQMLDPNYNWANDCRNNVSSPYSGIVIDPIGNSSVPAGGRYPAFESLYDGVQGNGGSTDVHIADCKVQYFVVAYMLNPHGTTQNVEIIRLTDCWGDYSYKAVAIGESQTRTFLVNGFYCWGGTETVFDAGTYGIGLPGTLPEVDGCNIAGNVKYLFQFGPFGVSEAKFQRVYAELLYSLGGDRFSQTIYGAATFTDCHFNINGIGGKISPILLRCRDVSFVGTYIRYYGNSLVNPLPVICDNVTSINSQIPSIFYNPHHTDGFTKVAQYIGNQETGTSSEEWTGRDDFSDMTNPSRRVLIGSNARLVKWSDINWSGDFKDKRKFEQLGFWGRRSQGSENLHAEIATVTLDAVNDKTIVTMANPERVALGDVICFANQNNTGFVNPDYASVSGTYPVLGVVESKSGSNVTLRGRVNHVISGASYSILVRDIPSFSVMMVGTVTNNSNVITDVVIEGPHPISSMFNIGDRFMGMDSNAFPHYAHITEINDVARTVTMSHNATYSIPNASLYTVDFEKSIENPSTGNLQYGLTWGLRAGDKMYPSSKHAKALGHDYWVCTQAGIFNTTRLPVLKMITVDATGLQAAIDGKAALSHTHPQSDITNLITDLAAKQATLVSGVNIKTINGVPILGGGDLSVSGGSQTLGQTMAIGNNTADKIIFDNQGNDVVNAWEYRPYNYNVSYGAKGRGSLFSGGWASFNVNGSGRPNVVGTMFGYNHQMGGGRIFSDEAAVGFRVETHYESGGDLVEIHIPEYTSQTGTAYRLLSWYLQKNGAGSGPHFEASAIKATKWGDRNTDWFSVGQNGRMQITKVSNPDDNFPMITLESLIGTVSGVTSTNWAMDLTLQGDIIFLGHRNTDAARTNPQVRVQTYDNVWIGALPGLGGGANTMRDLLIGGGAQIWNVRPLVPAMIVTQENRSGIAEFWAGGTHRAFDIQSEGIVLRNGTTSGRPVSQNGTLRYNTDTHKFEGVENGLWVNFTGGGGGGASWGGITGTLSSQTDLQSALNAKQKTITSGTAAPTGGVDGDIYLQYTLN